MGKRIVRCEILDPRLLCEVHVTYDNGTSEIIFEYHPDEISLYEFEFIGLTAKEAAALCRKRYVEYMNGLTIYSIDDF